MLDGLVLGLLDTSQEIGDPAVAQTYRGLTISWSRYGYQDVILEYASVDEILTAAVRDGYRYCLIQAYGCVLAERWRIGDQPQRDFFEELASWVSEREFFVAGEIRSNDAGWYGLADRWLLVDLQSYVALGMPRYHEIGTESCCLPDPQVVRADERLVELRPSGGECQTCPELAGWQWIRTGLEGGHSIVSFPDALRRHMLDLEPESEVRQKAFAPFLGQGIANYSRPHPDGGLSADQRCFLDILQAQTSNARQGVFLWNIESYADIEQPDAGFQAPVSSLYSVAAGFKPCRLLKTHGIGPQTRVVYCDYSQRALEVRRCLVEEWDGHDFPRFVRYLFQRFPYPETFYQLWDNATPLTVDWQDVERVCQRELDRWGGERPLADFWQEYQQLEHLYVCCNLLVDPQPLFDVVNDESSAIIWWSNAFFTMYGNWFYSLDERQRAYDHLISQLAGLNPRLHLFGSDFNNTNVNSVRAAEYWEQYRRSQVDATHPCKLYRTAVRM